MEKLAERPALTPTPPSPDESGVVCLEDLIRLGGGASMSMNPRDVFLTVSTPLSGDGLGLPAERVFAAPISDQRRALPAQMRQVVATAAAALLIVGAAGAAAQFYERMVPPAALSFSGVAPALSAGPDAALAFAMVDVPGVVGLAETPPTSSLAAEAVDAPIIARRVATPRPLRSSSAPTAVRRNDPTEANTVAAPTERHRAPLAGSFGDLVNSEASGASGMSLPMNPTREQVRVGMRPASTRVLACGGPAGAVVTTRVVIDGPSGRVQSATVLGELAGTPVASCMEREIARSRFDAFTESAFEVGYPFRL